MLCPIGDYSPQSDQPLMKHLVVEIAPSGRARRSASTGAASTRKPHTAKANRQSRPSYSVIGASKKTISTAPDREQPAGDRTGAGVGRSVGSRRSRPLVLGLGVEAAAEQQAVEDHERRDQQHGADRGRDHERDQRRAAGGGLVDR